ncbi:hypothetical protein ACQPT2_16750 [Erwinia amylovora]
MKKTCSLAILFLLSGCVDLDQVILHPELKTAYFNGHPGQVENCLDSAALNRNLSLREDEPLSNGDKRFNLFRKEGEHIASIDDQAFGKGQTSVNFYYVRNDPDALASITAMIEQCKKSLY